MLIDIFGDSPERGIDGQSQGAVRMAWEHSADQALRLFVKGLSQAERGLLQGSVTLSRRRAPRLELLDDAQADTADVLMIDARDPSAMQWASSQNWLSRKAVIWIDAVAALNPQHMISARPVQWPILPILLVRALEKQSAAMAGATAQAASPRGGGNRVLVVDDSPSVQAYLRSLLEPRGFLVTEANSGEAALAATATALFDCILMDIVMPGMDGFECCHRIKERARARSGQVPAVVMLTGRSSPFNHVRGRVAGCDAYLTKPVDPPALFEVLALHAGALPANREAWPQDADSPAASSSHLG